MIEIETTARTAPAATACSLPTRPPLQSARTVPPRSVRRREREADRAEQSDREALSMTASDDRLRGSVGLDGVPDEDTATF